MNEIISEMTMPLIEYFKDVLRGACPWPIVPAVDLLLKSLSISDMLFYQKFNAFISENDYFISKDRRLQLSSKLCEKENDNEHLLRVLSCIDKADSKRKAIYLNNASRALCMDLIDRSQLFLIFNAISITTLEDLQYLASIKEKNNIIPYNLHTIGLYSSGLILMDGINGGDFEYRPFMEYQHYVISELGDLVCKYAILNDGGLCGQS